ncbi:PIN domain-containing protein [Pseudorhodoferax sp. Leaf267]|uniref:PIN domain-containing protein n=1 Tax=Pseudorhodoferax sp. Leaf267 TaxID=1736316 RepID=UPI0012E14F83|nr:PIN domain-containing protein [Pseudorhodoferax sp. Leaf267]
MLTSRKITAFTLDTSVIRAAGYHFEHGALRQLAHQLPPWVRLWMSSIVVKEVERQRLAAVEAAADQAKQAWTNLHRRLDQPVNDGAVHNEVDLLAAAAGARFDDQMARLLATHGGEVVDINKPWLAASMFDAYFAGAAPFTGGSKKHEFPDVAALLSLENLRGSATPTYLRFRWTTGGTSTARTLGACIAFESWPIWLGCSALRAQRRRGFAWHCQPTSGSRVRCASSV